MAQPQFNQWKLTTQENNEFQSHPDIRRSLGEDDGSQIDVTEISLDIDRQLERQIDASLIATLSRMLSSKVAEHRSQGFTIRQLEDVAANVTEILRNAGFILSWAYLPEQNIRNGTVTIAVLPGDLSAVTADGNGRYSTTTLLKPFSSLLGAPVEKAAIENSLMQLRDYPGLQTTVVFAPGATTGSSALTLRVSEDPFDIGFVVDNHGSRSTGKARLRSDLHFYNPFGRADKLTAMILQTFDPADNLYGAIGYETPIFRPDFALGLSYSQNSFDIGTGDLAGFGLGGDTDIASIYLNKTLRRLRSSRVDLALDFSVKNAVLDGTGRLAEDNLSVVSLELAAEGADDFLSGGINRLQVNFSQGISDFLGSMDKSGVSSNGAISTRLGGSGKQAGGDFSKTLLRYQRLQRVSAAISVLFRLEGQYTSDQLTSIEQFMMGGPNSVRAYPIAENLMDSGTFTSVEWIVDLAGMFDDRRNGSTFALSFFGDYAHGELNDPFGNENPDVDLSGAGLGISIGHTGNDGNRFALRLDVATPISHFEPSDNKDPQYFGQISYTFR